MTITAISRPAYDGVMPYPNHALAYEGSELTKVTGDRFQYLSELGTAKEKSANVLKLLREVADEPVMQTRRDSSYRLVSAIDEARRTISPYMNHAPGSPGFENNEVPRILADGSMHPDDLVNRKMNLAGSVQMHQETVLYRLPRTDLEGVNWQSVVNSLRTSERIDDLLIWGNDVTNGRVPDVPQAIRALEELDQQFSALIENAPGSGTDLTPGSGGLVSKITGLSTPVKLAGGAALAVGVIGAGVLAARD